MPESAFLTPSHEAIEQEPSQQAAQGAGPRLFLTVLAFFFVSGACGLLYQVVWTRKLVLFFGTTTHAVSTVLSIFFVGLAVGSLWGGRWADRTRQPLRLYGLFELVIGLWAILFILLVGRGEAAVVTVLRPFVSSRGMSVALRAFLAFIFLIVPVVLMGATLPLLAKFVTATPRVRGLRIGALYGLNTLGAVLGCAAVGFFLLPRYGYTPATMVGAAANISVGLLALALSVRLAASKEDTGALRVRDARGSPDTPTAESACSPRIRALVLTAFALSGFCALALEVLWTRLLTLLFIGTTYAFTAMLATLLCGIALGSLAASTIADKQRHPVSLLGVVQVLFGLGCLLMLPVFTWLPDKFAALRANAGYSWEGLIRAKFFLTFLVLFGPTFLSGMMFPIAVRAVTGGRLRLGRDVGGLYSANTFGGVLGALVGGYVLIPLLGTHWGIVVLAWALFSAGVVLLLACPTRPRWAKSFLVVASVGLLVGVLRVLPEDVTHALNKSYVPGHDAIIYAREGIEGTVVISESREDPRQRRGSNRALWINGVQATASIEKGVKMTRFQGALPMLFDRDYRLALFMCFGSGNTAGMLGLFDFERIDALDAARLFERDNLGVLDNPKLNKIVDDGRNFLLLTRNRYDLITFEPMPLAVAGVSTFYTQEYYRLCLDHLAPGGIVSQWVPLHSLNPELVRSLIYTFTTVFPEYCAWFINADLFLVGSNRPLFLDYVRARERLDRPAVQNALRQAGLDDLPELFACFLMSKAKVDEYARDCRPMDDDWPWAEFIAPKLMYERNVDDLLRELRPYAESPIPFMRFPGLDETSAQAVTKAMDRRHRARLLDLDGVIQYYSVSVPLAAEDAFKKALAIDANDCTAKYYLKELALARTALFVHWGEMKDAIDYLAETVKSLPDEPLLFLRLGDIYFDSNQLDKAAQAYKVYLSLGGTEARARSRVQAFETASGSPSR